MLHFSVESVRKLNQDFMNGRRLNLAHIPSEHRPIIEDFKASLTREQINAYYAQARKKVETSERL